jgi:hypothetical protein
MKTFSGFPDGELKMSALPEMFYTGLLPLIDDLPEMKVTVACFRLCWQKSGLVRWTTSAELMRDPALSDVPEEIAAGVMKAIRRGSLVGALDRSGLQYLFPNSELGQGRRRDQTRREDRTRSRRLWTPQHLCAVTSKTSGADAADRRAAEDANREFPPQWIEYAFAEAVKQNARSWAYVKRF